MGEIDKELKLHEVSKSKSEQLQTYSENLLSVLKRIFRDLVTHYESLKSNYAGDKMDTYNRCKEGLEILSISQGELEDFITNNRRLDIYENILKFIENSNYFDVSQLVETFINLKEKIIGFYRNSNNTLTDNYNTVTHSTIEMRQQNHPVSKYENFLSRVRDNSKNKEVINDMENLMKNLKHLNENK
jgi:hypothetical protein